MKWLGKAWYLCDACGDRLATAYTPGFWRQNKKENGFLNEQKGNTVSVNGRNGRWKLVAALLPLCAFGAAGSAVRSFVARCVFYKTMRCWIVCSFQKLKMCKGSFSKTVACTKPSSAV